MLIEIEKDIVFVDGAFQSAIYNFNNGKVYAINKEGTEILHEVFQFGKSENIYAESYLQQLKQLINISSFSKCKDYTMPQRPEAKLRHVWLEVTQLCNCRCIHCYEGQEHKEIPNPIDVVKWKSIIDELALLKCPSIQFIGGEPSIYKSLPELVIYARQVGIKNITIYTNLNYLSEELYKAIVEANASVKTSIYGATSMVHDKVTSVEGSFLKMKANLLRLLESKVKVIAAVVIMRENLEDKANIFSMLRELGVQYITYDEIRKVYGGAQTKHLLPEGYSRRTKPNFKAEKAWFNKSHYINTCWYGCMVISNNGIVYPCEFERNINYGNVKEISVKDILNSKKLQECWFMDFSYIKECKNCEYRFACKDCRPLAYAENGNLYEKSPRCGYCPKNGEWQ